MRLITHPSEPGRKFTSMTDPLLWPADAFTFKRLADGSILQPSAPPLESVLTVAPPKTIA